MFKNDFFVKRKPRSFGFTPFYYQEKKNTDKDERASRIHFQRMRTSMIFGKKSMRSMIIMAVLSGATLVYFMRLVESDLSTSELEKIRIEEVQTRINP